MTALAQLVATSAEVAATRSRMAKIQALARLLGDLDPAEIPVAVPFLVGEVRQRRLGVGWVTAWNLDVATVDDATLHLGDVDAVFATLAEISGVGSQGERLAQLTSLFERATPAEQDFLKRLLVGEVRQGALEGVLADAIAVAAGVPKELVRRAAMLLGDLAAAAVKALSSGQAALEGVGLQVMTPIQPMLASTAPTVADALAHTLVGNETAIEWKLDGIRIQVHRDGDAVRVFTRNLNDVTFRLDRLVEAMLGLDGRRFILDGELIGLSEDDAPKLFQDTASSFAAAATPTFTLNPFFFDCLHVDGVDLIDEPLRVRRDALCRLVGDLAIPALHTADEQAAEAFAAASLVAGHEGVVVKDLDSPYEAGRRGKSWRKVKPVLTLDLVVIGVEWGSGRRQGWLSNLHLGARDPGGGPPVMVGKTFKGMTDELLAWQTKTLATLQVAERGHVVFVRPELVIEIAIDGVQRSSRYPGGVALRFARVKRYRPDKTPAEADTIDALKALLR